mgnify:CR=1 FL=1
MTEPTDWHRKRARELFTEARMENPLHTPSQNWCDAMARYIAQHEPEPSVEDVLHEVVSELAKTPWTASCHIAALAKRGFHIVPIE